MRKYYFENFILVILLPLIWLLSLIILGIWEFIVWIRKNMKEELCKYWIELDDERGMYEYCRYKNKCCTCSATFKQCDFGFKKGELK